MDKNTCGVVGCAGPVRARGFCMRHYDLLRRTGSTNEREDAPGLTAPLVVRFWRYVKKQNDTDACWEWEGKTEYTGYGRLKHDGKSLLAHRVSWTLHNGDIPDGLLVCHKCDNPPCVNPNHLFIGTQKENLADRAAKGRFHPTKGDRHGMSKLTEKDVVSVIMDGRSFDEIASIYGVTRSNIHYIKTAKSWKHLHEVITL